MKHICFSLVVLMFGALLFGAEPVVEVFSSGDQLSKDEINWLPNAAGEKLESNLSMYTDFYIVNGANKRQIINIQKESESGIYDESTAIEVGKLTSASHGIFLNVRKANNKYSVSINYTDLESGKIITSLVSLPVSSIEELYILNGCSINELTIDFCDTLNIPLTPSDRYVLLNGDKDLPDSERNALLKENIEKFSQQLDYLDKQISILSSDFSFDAGVKQSQLEAMRALTEEKLIKANADKERALAYAEKKRKDEIVDMERSQDQKEKINKTSIILNEKMKELGEVPTVPILSLIGVAESVKQTYVDIVNETENEKKAILDDAASEISFKKQEIEERPLDNSEVNGQGGISSTAALNREKEFLDFKAAREKQANKDVNKFVSKMEKQQKALLKEIEKSYKKFSSGTLNSLGGNLIVDFGSYDGERFGWDLFITIESEDRIIFKSSSFISYVQLTGKNPVTNYKSLGFDNYMETVDYFTSLFSRGEPYLTFTIDYKIEPLDKRYPSQYKFNFSNFQVSETKNVSFFGESLISIPLAVLELGISSWEIQMYPSHDLRSTEDLQLEARHFEEQLWGTN